MDAFQHSGCEVAMAKSTKKPRTLTTSEALEELLGRKAAKRLRRVASELAEAGKSASRKDNKKRKKNKKR